MRSVSRASMFMWMSSSAVVNGNCAGLDFRRDALQTVADRHHILRADHPDLAKHRGVREGAPDVLAPQFLVEADGGIDVLHDRGRPGGEASAPLLVGGSVSAI